MSSTKLVGDMFGLIYCHTLPQHLLYCYLIPLWRCCAHRRVFLFVPSDSRRIINLSPVMVIPEEQPAQPALPIQPEGMRVVCGHCGNTFLVRKTSEMTNLSQSQAR